MMKRFFTVAVLMFSALCFVSCNKEQTRLQIDDIPGRAEITGTLVINYGKALVGGKLVDRILPVANTEVIIKLNNSSFMPGAYGTTDYRTMTNAEGEYSVKIPVPDSGVAVTVTVADILGTYMDGSSEEVRGVFSFYRSVSGVKPGNIKIVSGEFEFEEEDEF